MSERLSKLPARAVDPVAARAALDPARITVVGASNRATNAGLSFVRALRAARFAGELTVLNRDGESVEGAAGHRSWSELGDPPDLAIIALPAAMAVDALEQAADAGVGAVHLFSGGFAERGSDASAADQRRLRAIADRAGIVLVGPNGMGLYRPRAGLAFRSDQPMLDGRVGLVSQSGGVAIAAIHQLAARDVGVGTAVSYGNGAQLGAGWWARAATADGEVGALGVYVESANEPDLADTLERICADTPVVLCTGPGDDAARAAARRHTGSPGGDLRAGRWPPGVLRVDSVERWVAALDWFTTHRPPTSVPRVAVLTISGGIGVLGATALGRAGVPLAEIGDGTRAAIHAIAPRALIATENPIDLGAAYLSRRLVSGALDALRADPGVDLTVFHLMWDHLREVDRDVPGYAARYLQLLIEHAAGRADVAVYFPRVLDDHGERQVRRRLRAAGIPVAETLDVAASALSVTAPRAPAAALESVRQEALR